jgi:hypothetical protein
VVQEKGPRTTGPRTTDGAGRLVTKIDHEGSLAQREGEVFLVEVGFYPGGENGVQPGAGCSGCPGARSLEENQSRLPSNE